MSDHKDTPVETTLEDLAKRFMGEFRSCKEATRDIEETQYEIEQLEKELVKKKSELKEAEDNRTKAKKAMLQFSNTTVGKMSPLLRLEERFDLYRLYHIIDDMVLGFTGSDKPMKELVENLWDIPGVSLTAHEHVVDRYGNTSWFFYLSKHGVSVYFPARYFFGDSYNDWENPHVCLFTDDVDEDLVDALANTTCEIGLDESKCKVRFFSNTENGWIDVYFQEKQHLNPNVLPDAIELIFDLIGKKIDELGLKE